MLVVGCSGQILAAANTGYTLSMRLGPELSGQSETVIAEVNPGGGTGYEKRQLTVLSRHGGELRTLWSTDVFERDQSIPSQGGSEKVSTVHFSTHGDTIQVAGFAKSLTYNESHDVWKVRDSVARPIERYCWGVSSASYQRC
jgi:hypothetical protein